MINHLIGLQTETGLCWMLDICGKTAFLLTIAGTTALASRRATVLFAGLLTGMLLFGVAPQTTPAQPAASGTTATDIGQHGGDSVTHRSSFPRSYGLYLPAAFQYWISVRATLVRWRVHPDAIWPPT